MIDGLRTLAIVPARGGSKGVPRKNLRVVGDKPLIGWTIAAAQASSHVDRVIVSSDDDEICGAAARYGDGIALKRPAELATDEATSLDVVLHAVDALPGFDVAILLQPTSPLRITADIDGCLEMMVRRGANSCVGVCEVSESPYWMYRLDGDDRLVALLDTKQNFNRRQDLPPVFLPNGAVYAFRVDWIRTSRLFIDAETIGYVMPASRSLDIDTELDMLVLEQMIKSQKG